MESQLDGLSLTRLADGDSAVVEGYSPALETSRRERFEDLGLTLGEPVVRERSAPLGDPIVLRVRGTLLCLRREDARHIRIRISSPSLLASPRESRPRRAK